ncbi:DegT/DnrJ/EryC1/StrS family aminotransferase, partial [Pseudomonas viridiflava]
IHYPIADHKQPAYNATASVALDVTEQSCDTVISLPCFPGLTDEEVNRVIDAVTAYFSKEQ